jgi:hypothetical protein
VVNQVMPLLHKPGQWPQNTPQEFRSYLQASETLPEWADAKLLAHSEEFLNTNDVTYNLSLIFLSLPVLSAWQTGAAQTLTLTGQLTKHFARRVSETLRFVIAVTDPGGLGPQGEGIRSIQRVRLMHATIRHFAHTSKVSDGSSYWNAQWGRAINQETMVATMLAFSTVNLRGMRKLGIHVTAQDEEAVLHRWKVIGHILGIDANFMPSTVEEAHLMWEKCVQRNFGHTRAADELTRAHIGFVRDIAKNHPLTQALLGDADESMMRYLMGRKVARMIGIAPPGPVGRAVDWLRRVVLRQTEDVIDNNKFVRQIVDAHSAEIMHLVRNYLEQANNSRPFAIPSEQEAQAGVSAAWELNRADARRVSAAA